MWHHPNSPHTEVVPVSVPPPHQSQRLPWEAGRKSGKTDDLTKEVNH